MTTIAAGARAQPKRRKRPFGVNAIIVISALTLIYGILLAVTVSFDLGSAEPILSRIVSERWLVVYFITTSLLNVVIIIGLWRMKRWGWFLVMINTGVGMFLNIWAYFYAQPNYFAMAASVLIVLYMNQRDVQQVFIDLPPDHHPPPTIT